MKVLALDTSTLMSSIAIIDEDRLIGQYSLNLNMSHSERLIPMIKSILGELDIDLEEIDLYGVATGPGSFTGLRIGLASIKGFAHVYDKPIVGVSTLKGLAYNMAYNEIVVPMIDARRDRVYTAIYRWEGTRLESLMEPSILDIDDLIEKLRAYDRIHINGNASQIHRARLEDRLEAQLIFAKQGQNSSSAVSIAEIALEDYRKGLVDDFYNIKPDYLRMSQAERQLKEGK